MIAKLITHGDTREEAIARMREALDRFIIHGVSNNISFLSALMAHPRFVSGDMTTHMIGEEYPDGFSSADLPHENPAIIIAVAASMGRRYRDRAAEIEGQLGGHEREVPGEWVVLFNGDYHPVVVMPTEGGHDVTYEGKVYAVRTDWAFGQRLFSGTINGEPIHVQVERMNQDYRLARGGSTSTIQFMTPRAAELHRFMPARQEADTSRQLISPMPGLLVSISVQEGQEIKAGEELAVLEAMKMENTLRAERNATVAKVHFEAGASVEVGDIIMEFE
jgi:propionyl-CoA carboxylase alpha chain